MTKPEQPKKIIRQDSEFICQIPGCYEYIGSRYKYCKKHRSNYLRKTPKKVRLSLYIDEDLIKKARERCLNISAFVRKKLREELEEFEEFEKLKYKPF